VTDYHERFFSDRVRWQSWLDVEAELAGVQADLGLIPQDAARVIRSKASLDCIDPGELKAQIEKTMAPVYAMSKVLAEACGDAGAYVHWGATTQNIIEAGRLKVLSEFHDLLQGKLTDVLDVLAGQALAHADLIMVGRTNRQNALPITYGYKIASWIDELLRMQQRLGEVESRFFELRFGGAIGSYQSFGAHGPEIADRLANRLGLRASMMPSRACVDPTIEYICVLSALGVGTSRIADELYLLMSEEIGEVSEVLDSDVVGSSTMPQKTNPKLVIDVRAQAALLKAKAGVAMTLPSPSHDGDAATNRELSLLLAETCPLALTLLDRLQNLLDHVVPVEERMRENYLRTKALMATEALMMRLAPEIGRGQAHDLVHHAVSLAAAGKHDLLQILKSDTRVSELLSRQELDSIFANGANLGLCGTIARQNAERILGRKLSAVSLA